MGTPDRDAEDVVFHLQYVPMKPAPSVSRIHELKRENRELKRANDYQGGLASPV